MANANLVVLMGNTTRDVEIRTAANGTKIAKVGLALNEQYTDSDGEVVKKTHYVDLTAFGKTATVMGEYVQKGSLIYVEGKLNYSSWEGKDGQKRSKLDVIVNRLQLMPKGDGNKTTATKKETVPPQDVFDETEGSEIPF